MSSSEPPFKIHRLTELRNEDGELVSLMCCICFEFVPVSDLWRDPKGQAWDLCDSCGKREGSRRER